MLLMKKLLKHFMKKKQQKNKPKRIQNRKNVIKRKENKLYVKWKGYDNSFNS